ncbi:MAG: TfoX/Sxy family protein [Bacteroidota bacterium]
MAVNQSYLNYVIGQLSEVPDFTWKKMFGGVGFFRGDAMWGAIMSDGDTFRLKVDATNQAVFEAAGSSPFAMEMKGKQMSMPYWTVPEHVVADPTKLSEWVEVAAQVAERKKKKKR